MKLSLPYESSCTGDCNQGRNCTCAPARDEPLAAARGIVNGLLMAIPVWAIVGLIAWALSGCAPIYEESIHPDQCLRREIMMQCLATVKNGANSVHQDLGPLVNECQSAAYYQSLRRGHSIKQECRI